MANESICAEFPDTWEEFVEKWAYDINIFDKEDRAETAHERVIDIYRVKQMMWYYLRDYLKIGAEYSTNDFEVIVAADPTCDLRSGSPRFTIIRRGVKGLV